MVRFVMSGPVIKEVNVHDELKRARDAFYNAMFEGNEEEMRAANDAVSTCVSEIKPYNVKANTHKISNKNSWKARKHHKQLFVVFIDVGRGK